jgi:hypothetical protein
MSKRAIDLTTDIENKDVKSHKKRSKETPEPEWVVFHGVHYVNSEFDVVFKFDRTSTVYAPTILEILDSLGGPKLGLCLVYFAGSDEKRLELRNTMNQPHCIDPRVLDIQHMGTWTKERSRTRNIRECSAFKVFIYTLEDRDYDGFAPPLPY